MRILTLIHDHITFGNWGLAIIVMTLGLRTLLFPLTWKSIKTRSRCAASSPRSTP